MVDVSGDHEDFAILAHRTVTKKAHEALERGGISGHILDSASHLTEGISSVTSGSKVSDMSHKLSAGASDMAHRISASAKGLTHREEHFDVKCVVDMRKPFDSDDVKVEITEFDCDRAVLRGIMHSDVCKHFIEVSLSAKASEVASKKATRRASPGVP